MSNNLKDERSAFQVYVLNKILAVQNISRRSAYKWFQKVEIFMKILISEYSKSQKKGISCEKVSFTDVKPFFFFFQIRKLLE